MNFFGSGCIPKWGCNAAELSYFPSFSSFRSTIRWRSSCEFGGLGPIVLDAIFDLEDLRVNMGSSLGSSRTSMAFWGCQGHNGILELEFRSL